MAGYPILDLVAAEPMSKTIRTVEPALLGGGQGLAGSAETIARLAHPQEAQLIAALLASARHLPPAAFAAAGDRQRPHAEVAVAVLVPCFNEAQSIASVVAGFRASLPHARIVVFDNASTDDTAAVARLAGAEVRLEPRPGKGNVVRRMFADIEADVYLLVDGDGTYDASAAARLVAGIVEDRADMVVAARANIQIDAHRAGHAFGNRLFNRCFGLLFARNFVDIFSGYRAFSRRFVKSFPALSTGFEIETELSVHACQLRLPTAEIELPYGQRLEGSHSKLNSLGDGWRILKTFGLLLKETRPAWFFGGLAALCMALSVVLAWPLFETWYAFGIVPRLPTAILCTGLVLIACLLAVCGLILDSLARFRLEQKRIFYLSAQDRLHR